MTAQELYKVRELRNRILAMTRHIETLRIAASNLVPVLDGMPHARNAESRVENLTLKIVESEKELSALREEFDATAAQLADKIKIAPLTMREREVLILRYVACERFRDISFQMNYSDAHVFRLHSDGVEKILRDKNDSKAIVE